MILNTRHFGTIDIDESKIISFELGLPGFENCKEFILLENDDGMSSDESVSLLWMQSVDNEKLAFVIMDINSIFPDYNPLVNTEIIEDLGEYSTDTFLIYNILVIPEDITKISVNLKAPVVINTATRRGKQVVVNNEEYTVRHYIFDEINKLK